MLHISLKRIRIMGLVIRPHGAEGSNNRALVCLGVCMPLYAFHFIIFTLTAGQRKTFLPPRLYALRQGVKLILEVCLVYVCLNLVLSPPGFGKLVAMGTDSPSRWCVMECDL